MNRNGLFSLSPKRIAALYLVFGIVWIGTTDSLVILLFDSPETITLVQSAKGWVFVALSGLLLYGLSYFHHQQFEASQQKLQTTSEQLQVLHRVFRHNIRNDLNVVLAHIDLTMRRTLGPQEGESLKTAKQTADEIIKMSDKLKVINSLELNGGDTTVELTDLAADSIRTVQRKYPEVEISTDFPEKAPVYGDYAIYQAVVELLENAVEHSAQQPADCEISLTITRRNGTIELEVIDNGPSIPDHEIESLRTETESKLVHMSGVGLWMVKWVCECHGGDVNIDTDSVDGTAVTLTFDRADRSPVIDQFAETASEVRSAPA